MTRSLTLGLNAAARAADLALVGWSVNAVFGAAFGWVCGLWLAEALDGSLATRNLLKSLDANVLVDLVVGHGEGMLVVLTTAVVLAAFYVVLWSFLDGALVASVDGNERPPLAVCLSVGARAMPGMLALWLLVAAQLAALTAALAAAGWGLLVTTAAHPDPRVAESIVACGLLLWIAGLLSLAMLHDHARIFLVREGIGPFAAYARALRFVRRGRRPALRVALVLNLFALVVWTIHQALDMQIATNGSLDMAGLLIWGEIYLLARMFLRLWFLGTQAALHGQGG